MCGVLRFHPSTTPSGPAFRGGFPAGWPGGCLAALQAMQQPWLPAGRTHTLNGATANLLYLAVVTLLVRLRATHQELEAVLEAARATRRGLPGAVLTRADLHGHRPPRHVRCVPQCSCVESGCKPAAPHFLALARSHDAGLFRHSSRASQRACQPWPARLPALLLTVQCTPAAPPPLSLALRECLPALPSTTRNATCGAPASSCMVCSPPSYLCIAHHHRNPS